MALCGISGHPGVAGHHVLPDRFGDVKYGQVTHTYHDLSEIRQLSDQEWVDPEAVSSSYFLLYWGALLDSLTKAGYDFTGDRVRGPEW